MFITFEGINGSGKSTQANMLFELLKQKSKDVVLTKEPGGGGEFCMELRRIVCKTKNISNLTEIFLLFAARKEHIDKVIKPALSSGKIVICDRYIDSTFAYQCYDEPERIDFVKHLHKEIGGLMPDKTFFIDIPVSESKRRLEPFLYLIQENEKKYDKLESEHMQKILDMYRKLADLYRNRITRIDGMLSPEEINKQIMLELKF